MITALQSPKAANLNFSVCLDWNRVCGHNTNINQIFVCKMFKLIEIYRISLMKITKFIKLKDKICKRTIEAC